MECGLSKITFDGESLNVRSLYSLKGPMQCEYFVEGKAVTESEYYNYRKDIRKKTMNFSYFDLTPSYPINSEQAWNLANDYWDNQDGSRDAGAGSFWVNNIVLIEAPSSEADHYRVSLQEEHYSRVQEGYECMPPNFVKEKDQILVLYPVKIQQDQNIISEQSLSSISKEDLLDFAQKDFITNYYNWTYMNQRLSSFGKEGVTDYCFVHFNVKDFNMINELFNHQAGNDHLCAITERIEECKDWIYFGSRCDNDNFALMIKDMPNDEIVKKMTEFFEPISYLKSHPTYKVYYKCGIVTMMSSLNAGRRVSDYAKIAQSLCKKPNQTEIMFYTKEMHDRVMYSKQIKAYLDTALKNNEFFIYLQPKINVETNSLEGAEALVRWNFKTKEILSPAMFIPYFETDDSISKIDTFVLTAVCKKLQEWKKQKLQLYPISVNLSRKQIEKINIVEHIKEIVDSYNIDHSLIDFELTESATIDNQESIQPILEELKSSGFKISMDDFGIGYSSFSLLKNIPFDTLKIDKSFVDNITSTSQEQSQVFKDNIIIKHIISMSNELGYKCIAEGAETESQVEKLKQLGCKVIQGYFFSKPLPIEEFETRYLIK
jgi:EAL domain-containing protein (putative c-di-GMP-specific phosphodiesterase class I)